MLNFSASSDGSTNTLLNRAYLCPRCGEIWAKINFGSKEWRLITRGCSSHKYYESEANGSLLENWREDVFVFPASALVYEVQQLLKE